MNPYVIIGNGTAACGCIEGIRSVDQENPILVLSEEKYPVYGRPLISYYLEGKTDLKHMGYRDADFYEKNRVQVLYGQKAASLHPDLHKILTDQGEALLYSKVCVAAGSSPFVPPMDGLEHVKQKYGFMTLEDALSLEKALTPDARVLIIGAGLIGLKCAEGIRDRVGCITVCDLADHILSSILRPEEAMIIQRHLEKNGLAFCLGDTAARFEENKAFMRSGKQIDFDILVLAVGVRANTGLVKEAGGKTDRGILADTHMATDLPDVFTAGDCCQGYDLSTGQNRVLAILPNAYMQGFTAGINMAGGNQVFDQGIPMNSIGFFSLHLMSAGVCSGQRKDIPVEGGLKRFYIQDGLLKGYILIGRTERAGIYTSLIREQIPLEGLDFDLLSEAATSAAFSPDIRRKKFGGMV